MLFVLDAASGIVVLVVVVAELLGFTDSFKDSDPLSVSGLKIINKHCATTDPRVEFLPLVQTQILIKFHLQNFDQASSSKSQPNISLSIKLDLQNLDQT